MLALLGTQPRAQRPGHRSRPIRRHLQRTLTLAGFNCSETARLLQIPRSTLQHYLAKYDIDPQRLRRRASKLAAG